MKPKVIFIDSVHPVLFERLSNSGYECEWKTDLNRSEIISILDEYEGAVIRSKFIFDQEIFNAASKLKWIARSGAGMENIDQSIAASRNIICYNSPEGNRDAVAEHALGMLLSLFNNLITSDNEVRQGQWNREKNRGIELKGKTVGILGYGFMGEALAERLSGFGVHVIANDKYKYGYSNSNVTEVDEATFFSKTDVLSIHLPLTDETTFMVDKQYISQFTKNIFLINTARGKNLKTKDLVECLKSGKVKGACLDVLEYELSSFENLNKADLPADFQYLANSEKVILSPHVAGWTEESYFKLSTVLADKILNQG